MFLSFFKTCLTVDRILVPLPQSPRAREPDPLLVFAPALVPSSLHPPKWQVHGSKLQVRRLLQPPLPSLPAPQREGESWGW